MKVMDADEFQDRLRALNRARRIFGDLTDQNISRAFEVYQVILAEQERAVFLTTSMGQRAPTILDKYERPKCPKCGGNLMLMPQELNSRADLMVGGNYKTLWVCENTDNGCEGELWSEKSIQQWMYSLKKKGTYGGK